jgi:hypothetical protein
MPGSSTTPGRSDLAIARPKRVAFRIRNGVGTRELAFAAQWLAYALPYRRLEPSALLIFLLLELQYVDCVAGYTGFEVAPGDRQGVGGASPLR